MQLFDENKIYILNLGGLANRINNLINGIFLSSHFKRELCMIWPINEACNCSFGDLFHNRIETISIPKNLLPQKTEDYYRIAGDQAFFYKKNWNTTLAKNDLPKKFLAYKEIGTGKKLLSSIESHKHGVLLQGNVLFSFIPFNFIMDTISSLKPVDDITYRINEFVIKNSLDKKVIGIHLRKTDYSKLNEFHLIKKIRKFIRYNSAQKIFLCSDSKNTEKKFKQLYPQNIIIHDKDFYPEKFNKNKPWRTEDRDFKKYNVFRSKESVKLSIVDLFLLAKTNFKIRSGGTFSQLAYYLSIHDNKLDRHSENLRRKIKHFIHS